jgi:4-diphosphocytidyl-2-C-methyl-D-erythritol kinase
MIRVTAHAKINFFLEITGKRPDGYHTLSTVFQTISLGDELTFQSTSELVLSCSDPNLPVDGRNLVMKAAVHLKEALKETRGARIHLEKKIPMGAGLGGGSSDAAAVLKTLPMLWGRRIGVTALKKIAVGLGADVPFFLRGGLCSATGIGNQLKPMKPLLKTWLVLVYPGFGVSTKAAYAKVNLPFADTPKRHVADPRQNLFNRFEDLVFPDHPELPRLKQELLNAGAIGALMSGSGSAVYGLVGSKQEGAQILAQMQKTYNQSWLVHTV